MPINIMIDCSHGNSNKDPANQPVVFNNCIDQIVASNDNIIGMMVESNLEWGKQPLGKDTSQLKRGVSITVPVSIGKPQSVNCSMHISVYCLL